MVRADKVALANIIADKIETEVFMHNVLSTAEEQGIKLTDAEVESFVAKMSKAVRTNFSKVIK